MYIADGDHTGPDRIALNPSDENLRTLVGGESNRWLNISKTITRQGSEDPDSKIFMCEVCEHRNTVFESCQISNYTSRIVGAPPVLTGNSSELYSNEYIYTSLMATQAFPCMRERSRRPRRFGNVIIMYHATVCRK